MITQKIKYGKFIFIRFSTLRTFHENGIKPEGAGGLYILSWDRAQAHIMTRKAEKRTIEALGLARTSKNLIFPSFHRFNF